MKRPPLAHRIVAVSISVVCLAASSAPVLASPNQVSTNSNDVAVSHLLNACATASPQGVLVEWNTGLETDTLGFNVYRVTNERRRRLNHSLIAGSVLISKARTQPYAWFDSEGTISSEYEIESVDLGGATSLRAAVRCVW